MRHGRLGIAVLLAVALAACSQASLGGQDAGDDVPAGCGDGFLAADEICDDGNRTGGDGCRADCRSDESCGNLVTDPGVGEQCDDGDGVGGDGCSADCRSDETCGNLVIDQSTGETCDDGDTDGGDGCSANCQSNEQCGNGVMDAGEHCDTSNQATPDCDPDCSAVECGDGVTNGPAGEGCDDANGDPTDACNGCAVAYCGDGQTHAGVEACDDGNGVNEDACAGCVAAFCGDGYTYAGVEACDDANASNGDSCVAGCVAARCGDGYTYAGVESCEDGNTNAGDGCGATCVWEPRHYLIPREQLVGMSFDCSAAMVSPYDACNGAQIGFTWVDSAPFVPGTVEVLFDYGVDCNGPQGKNTYLNGGFAGSFTLNGFGDCLCDPSGNLHTWNINPASYVVGGANTFVWDGSPSCSGFTLNGGFGSYARITVYP
jgi:cysteine-rich repeat protein